MKMIFLTGIICCCRMRPDVRERGQPAERDLPRTRVRQHEGPLAPVHLHLPGRSRPKGGDPVHPFRAARNPARVSTVPHANRPVRTIHTPSFRYIPFTPLTVFFWCVHVRCPVSIATCWWDWYGRTGSCDLVPWNIIFFWLILNIIK